MGFYEFILKIVEYLDLPTIMAISFMGFFLYDRAVKRTTQSENRLNERIDKSENRLNERIDKSENKLNERIDKSENNLRELVNQSENRLNERIDQSENNLKELVNSLKEQVNQSENNLRDLLVATIKPIQEQVYNHIPTQISKLEKKVDDMVKENNQNYRDILNLLNQHLSNELTKQKPPE